MLANTLVNGPVSGLGVWPDGVPTGPPTTKKPDGERLWICKDYAHLGPGRACVAMYGDTLGEMKGLQRGINAYIDRYGLPQAKISVDGTVGPKTLAAYQAVASHSGSLPATATADDLALLNYTQKLYKGVATLANATADTSSAVRPGEGSKMTWLWWLIGGAAVVGAGALGYSLYRRRDPKPKLKKKRQRGRVIRVRPYTRVV